MKNGNRKFYMDDVMHVYQRAIHGFNIFYTLEDFLVFYTIFSVFSRRFKITVLALCLMIDHFHALLISESRQNFYKFVSAVTARYSRVFNESIDRKGRLFDKSFGSSPKNSNKQVRTAVPYLFNNPVEKKICSNPADYMWNFLAYIYSDHPFSEEIISRKTSRRLKDTIAIINQCRIDEQWLNYRLLHRIYKNLSCDERKQLTDYIIIKYMPFDIEKLQSFYKSPEMMLTAIESNTGSEYNIKEEFNQNSDLMYEDIKTHIIKNITSDLKRVLKMQLDEKIELANQICANTMASSRQVAKYLHIPLQKRKS